MARFSMYIAFALFAMNLTAVSFAASGAYGDWGVGPDPGGDLAVEQANSSSSELVSQQAAGAQTLFLMFNVITEQLLPALTMMVVGGPIMFANLGAPDWLVGLIFGPAYLVIAADAAHLLIGRDTM